MATATASPGVSVAPLDSSINDPQRKRCVSCNALHPGDGKLLHCLHVICASCLSDSLLDPGTVKCTLCGEITSQKQGPLIKVLADSRPLLYASSGNGRTESASEEKGPADRVSCGFCSDIGKECDATHVCDGCAEPLCAEHAVRHGSRTGHHVTSKTVLTGRGSQERLRASSRYCPVHAKHVLVKYCDTCHCAVCQRCLDIGHKEHSVQVITEAAKNLRSQLKQSIPVGSGSLGLAETLPESGGSEANFSIAAKANDLLAEMEEVRQSATSATHFVAETFEKFEKKMKDKKDQLLADIDKRSWRLLQPLQEQQQQLQLFVQNEDTAMELIEVLTSTESCDDDVMLLSHVVTERLSCLPANVQSATENLKTLGVRIVVEAAASLEGFDQYLDSFVRVSDNQLDLAASDINVPDRILANEESVITLVPRNSIKERIPVFGISKSLLCTVVAPSGGKTRATVNSSSDQSPEPGTVDLTIHPTEIGSHCLEVRHVGDQSRSVQVQCVTPVVNVHVSLDPAKCSSRIRLTMNKRAAVLTRKAYSNVLAVEGYTTGSHTWSLKITKCCAEGDDSHIAAGVSTAPLDGGYDLKDYFYPPSRYFWKSVGGSTPSGSNTEKWQNGDELTFTLDCDAKTLELHLHRTNQRKVVKNLDCSKPLYPGLYLYQVGHEAEFIDC